MDAITREQVRQRAGGLCEYCRLPEAHVLTPFQLEYVVARQHRGKDSPGNLAYACLRCNNAKGVQTEARDPDTGQWVRLFDPRRQRWSEHFAWSADGARILGRTPCGRATVIALQMNNPIAVRVRQEWVAAGWHPPQDSA